MSQKDELIKSKTFYTLRKKHEKIYNGDIFENDYVTILRNEDVFNNDIPIYSDSNFKFRIPSPIGSKKKHSRGSWSLNNNNGSTWTLNDVPQMVDSDNNKIVIKPNYSSFSDFAYYGSAVELLRATINDIILRYPGSLSFYNEKYVPSIEIGNKTYYYISNECNLDFWSKNYSDSIYNLKDPMKILSFSYNNYVNSNGEEITSFSSNITGNCLGTIIGNVSINKFINLQIYLDNNGKRHLITEKNSNYKSGIIMMPKETIVQEFWDSLDDFEKLLLNRNTKPIYKAKLETPYIKDYKHFYEYKDYVWPTVEGINPDLTTANFQGYLRQLMQIAEYYDEYESDNLYRMMTHEAIKNMDYSIINSDYDDIDNSKIAAMIHIHGRMYDDIKRYIGNIKSQNKISYDEKNNIPDYFLSDVIELNGWGQTISINTFNNGTITENIFSGSSSSGKTTFEIDSCFMRNLSLSSHYLNSLKGTKRGIEYILGMFGYKNGKGNGDYEINEYVNIVTGNTSTGLSYDDWFNYIQLDDNIVLNEFDYSVLEQPYLYFPINIASTGNNNYLIPWFDKDLYKRTGMYFQQYGGWGRLSNKDINLNYITSISGLTNVYSETYPYLSFASDINNMTSMRNSVVFDNMICYVDDIHQIYDEEFYVENDNNNDKKYSHYFILKNKALSSSVGFVDNDFYSCYGWKNIHLTEFDGTGTLTIDGKRVLYLESLNLNSNGNNPHCGFGNYDNGSKYFTNFERIFSYDIENNAFDTIKDDDVNTYINILNFGFENEEIIDNKKCYYFGSSELICNGNDALDSTLYDKFNKINISNIKSDESVSDFIINSKKITIIFHTGGNKFFESYLQNIVFKYLFEMVPSTTILNIIFDKKESAAPIVDGETEIITDKSIRLKADIATVGNDNMYLIEDNNALIS